MKRYSIAAALLSAALTFSACDKLPDKQADALAEQASSLADLASELEERERALEERENSAGEEPPPVVSAQEPPSSSAAEPASSSASEPPPDLPVSPESAPETSPSSAPPESPASSAPPESSSSGPEKTLDAPAVPDASGKLSQARAQFPGTVSWLTVPNTDINEPVLQGPSNETYYHKDASGRFIREWEKTHCLYMDYECALGNGSAAALPQNVIIYGVNYGTWEQASERTGWKAFYNERYDPASGEIRYRDEADKEKADEICLETDKLTRDDSNAPKFSQLSRFTSADFARANPYVYLETASGSQTYQIFAVSYTNAITSPVYNRAAYSSSEFSKLVADMRRKSLYEYKVPVLPDDKLLTLSTDTFRYAGQTDDSGNRAKLVVMARLVKEGETIQPEAELTVNPNPFAPDVSYYQ